MNAPGGAVVVRIMHNMALAPTLGVPVFSVLPGNVVTVLTGLDAALENRLLAALI